VDSANWPHRLFLPSLTNALIQGKIARPGDGNSTVVMLGVGAGSETGDYGATPMSAHFKSGCLRVQVSWAMVFPFRQPPQGLLSASP